MSTSPGPATDVKLMTRVGNVLGSPFVRVFNPQVKLGKWAQQAALGIRGEKDLAGDPERLIEARTGHLCERRREERDAKIEAVVPDWQSIAKDLETNPIEARTFDDFSRVTMDDSYQRLFNRDYQPSNPNAQAQELGLHDLTLRNQRLVNSVRRRREELMTDPKNGGNNTSNTTANSPQDANDAPVPKLLLSPASEMVGSIAALIEPEHEHARESYLVFAGRLAKDDSIVFENIGDALAELQRIHRGLDENSPAQTLFNMHTEAVGVLEAIMRHEGHQLMVELNGLLTQLDSDLEQANLDVTAARGSGRPGSQTEIADIRSKFAEEDLEQRIMTPSVKSNYGEVKTTLEETIPNEIKWVAEQAIPKLKKDISDQYQPYETNQVRGWRRLGQWALHTKGDLVDPEVRHPQTNKPKPITNTYIDPKDGTKQTVVVRGERLGLRTPIKRALAGLALYVALTIPYDLACSNRDTSGGFSTDPATHGTAVTVPTADIPDPRGEDQSTFDMTDE